MAVARLARIRTGLSSGQEALVELVESSGELRASFGGSQDWSAEALQAIEASAGRAEVVREAAESGSRAGSRLRLALRGLDATADELDHLSALL